MSIERDPPRFLDHHKHQQTDSVAGKFIASLPVTVAMPEYGLLLATDDVIAPGPLLRPCSVLTSAETRTPTPIPVPERHLNRPR